MSKSDEFSAAIDFCVNGANIRCYVISDFYVAANKILLENNNDVTSLDKVAYWDAVMKEYKDATGGSFFVTDKQNMADELKKAPSSSFRFTSRANSSGQTTVAREIQEKNSPACWIRRRSNGRRNERKIATQNEARSRRTE